MLTIPKSVVIDGVETEIAGAWSEGVDVPVCPDWKRRTKTAPGGKGVVNHLVRWSRVDGVELIDLASDSAGITQVVVFDQNGKLETLSLPPLTRLPFSSEVFGQVGDLKTGPTAGDQMLGGLVAKGRIDLDYDGDQESDYWYAGQTGSPRNMFEIPIDEWIRDAGQVSVQALNFLHEFTDYQTTRPYQDLAWSGSSDLNGQPAALINGVVRKAPETKSRYSLLHMTVDYLECDWRIRRSPRATDQIFSLLSYAMVREAWYDPQDPAFYYKIPRIPGWFFRAVRAVCRIARQAINAKLPGWEAVAAIATNWKNHAKAHALRIWNAWTKNTWSPFANTDSAGGHTHLLHDIPFMQAVLAHGCFAMAEFDVDFRKLGLKIARWLDKHGWMRGGERRVRTCYDAIHPDAGASLFLPIDGVGYWLWHPLKKASEVSKEDGGFRSDYLDLVEQHLRETNFRGYGPDSHWAKAMFGRWAREIMKGAA